jgi:hypothetical protein
VAPSRAVTAQSQRSAGAEAGKRSDRNQLGSAHTTASVILSAARFFARALARAFRRAEEAALRTENIETDAPTESLIPHAGSSAGTRTVALRRCCITARHPHGVGWEAAAAPNRDAINVGYTDLSRQTLTATPRILAGLARRRQQRSRGDGIHRGDSADRAGRTDRSGGTDRAGRTDRGSRLWQGRIASARSETENVSGTYQTRRAHAAAQRIGSATDRTLSNTTADLERAEPYSLAGIERRTCTRTGRWCAILTARQHVRRHLGNEHRPTDHGRGGRRWRQCPQRHGLAGYMVSPALGWHSHAGHRLRCLAADGRRRNERTDEAPAEGHQQAPHLPPHCSSSLQLTEPSSLNELHRRSATGIAHVPRAALLLSRSSACQRRGVTGPVVFLSHTSTRPFEAEPPSSP